MIFSVIFWYLFCGFLAAAQGLLMPAIRLTPPGAEARRQAFALHCLLLVVYFAPLAWHPSWSNLLMALAARVLVFDAALNHYAGDPVLYVGKTAATDKLLRRLAPAHPERLSLVLRLITSALLAGGALWVAARAGLSL